MKKARTGKIVKSMKKIVDKIKRVGSRPADCVSRDAKPRTVNVYEAMNNLANPRANVEDPVEKIVHACVDHTEKSIRKKFKLGKWEGRCTVWDLKSEAVMGRDPDRPDVISNCGNVYVSMAAADFESWRASLSAIEAFMSELERRTGREALITYMGIEASSVRWGFMFRVGKPKNVKLAPKRNNRK